MYFHIDRYNSKPVNLLNREQNKEEIIIVIIIIIIIIVFLICQAR